MTEQIDKVLVLDLDGTLTNGERDYTQSTPRLDMIEKVNSYYDSGWRIIIFTARGMVKFASWILNDVPDVRVEQAAPVKAAVEAYGKLTYDWLLEHGVKFHHLRFGKPAAIRYVDDKAMKPEEFLAATEL